MVVVREDGGGWSQWGVGVDAGPEGVEDEGGAVGAEVQALEVVPAHRVALHVLQPDVPERARAHAPPPPPQPVGWI